MPSRAGQATEIFTCPTEQVTCPGQSGSPYCHTLNRFPYQSGQREIAYPAKRITKKSSSTFKKQRLFFFLQAMEWNQLSISRYVRGYSSCLYFTHIYIERQRQRETERHGERDRQTDRQTDNVKNKASRSRKHFSGMNDERERGRELEREHELENFILQGL